MNEQAGFIYENFRKFIDLSKMFKRVGAIINLVSERYVVRIKGDADTLCIDAPHKSI
jgi:hypothetical protein